jgi:CRP/FNR family transcriptional regulator
MTMLCNQNAEEKVGTFLCTMSTRLSQLGYFSTNFKLAMSRQDIGNYLGLTVETVSRILGRFQKDHIIAISNKSVELLNLDQLCKACMTCNNNTLTDCGTAS